MLCVCGTQIEEIQAQKPWILGLHAVTDLQHGHKCQGFRPMKIEPDEIIECCYLELLFHAISFQKTPIACVWAQ